MYKEYSNEWFVFWIQQIKTTHLISFLSASASFVHKHHFIVFIVYVQMNGLIFGSCFKIQ